MSATLGEVAAALGDYPNVRCAPRVEADDDGNVTLTVVVDAHDNGHDALNVFVALQRVIDIAQMRALCARYDIDMAWLERWLNREEDR